VGPVSDQGMPKKQRYQFIPRVLIFVENEDRILLIKGAPDKKIWPNLFNGLGGHIERGESVIQAATREVFEESGLKINDLWLCACITIDTEKDLGIVMWVFRGTASDRGFQESAEGKLEWINLEDISNSPLVVDLSQLIPAIFTLEKGSTPLWGRYWYDEKDEFRMELSPA